MKHLLYSQLFLCLLLWPQFGLGVPDEELSPGKIKVAPSLISQSGKRRVQEHLQIIEDNVKNTENNLTATKKNIIVIESEIKELTDLEKEHFSLKKKYIDYLATASVEMEKNEKAMNDLQKFEKKAADIAKDAKAGAQQREQLETAHRERAEREKWKTEAKTKVDRVTDLLRGVSKNLASISGRREPLRAQLKTWSDKQLEYENLLKKLVQKKTDDERLLATLKRP